MSRLSKLYDAMQTLRNEGLALEDIENQVSQLEEETKGTLRERLLTFRGNLFTILSRQA